MYKEWTGLWHLLCVNKLNRVYKVFYSTEKTLVLMSNNNKALAYVAIMRTSYKCFRIMYTAQYHARRRAMIDMYISCRTHLDIIELLKEIKKDLAV